MFRRTSSLLIALATTVASVGPACALSPRYTGFDDVPGTHANVDAIVYVKGQGIVSGYPDGTFRPDQAINRAEFVKMMVSLLYPATGCELRPDEFRDVSSEQWFGVYVCVGVSDGWIQGYPDGTFRPAANINFVEAAKIIVNVFNAYEDCGNGIPCPLVGDYDHPWYEEFVRGLESKHAIPLSITRFDQLITRGEMAEMIYRLKTGVTTKPSATYDSLHRQWQTYTNTRYRFRINYPVGGGLLSNTFATEPEKAANVVVGPVSIDILDTVSWSKSSDYESTYKQYMTLSPKGYAYAVQQMNVEDDNPYVRNKQVGEVEFVTVAGRTSYRFWATASFKNERGGRVLDQKTYFEYFDSRGTIYEVSYTEANEAEARSMLNTFEEY